MVMLANKMVKPSQLVRRYTWECFHGLTGIGKGLLGESLLVSLPGSPSECSWKNYNWHSASLLYRGKMDYFSAVNSLVFDWHPSGPCCIFGWRGYMHADVLFRDSGWRIKVKESKQVQGFINRMLLEISEIPPYFLDGFYFIGCLIKAEKKCPFTV